MSMLGDLPWLRCDGPSGLPGLAALAEAARDLTAPLCVLVLSDIRPWPDAQALSPDAALLGSGRPILYPARNALTGDGTADHGLWVLPPTLAVTQAEVLWSGKGARALAPIVPPTLAAEWDCATTPEAAFRAGHAAMDAPHTPALALTASLGADRPNGLWWGIGAARALLGDGVEAAWADESARQAHVSDPSARRLELARLVRVRCGLPMHPFDATAAAALRGMRAPLAPAALWDRHIAALQDLMPGTDDAPTIAGHRLARAALWGSV